MIESLLDQQGFQALPMASGSDLADQGDVWMAHAYPVECVLSEQGDHEVGPLLEPVG